MQHIFNVPLPIIFSVLEHLNVEEVWEMRAVCKSFHHICTNFFKEKLKVLYLNETWLCDKLFGRTIEILRNCTHLKVLAIELQHSISTNKILTLFHNLLKSNCNLSECSLNSFTLPECSLPNITESLLTVRKLSLVNLVCNDWVWERLFACLLQPRARYASLEHLSLQLLSRYDGIDLVYLGRNCPNMISINVSYCSQLKSEYLESSLRELCKLQSVRCLYVPSVKNSTVRVLTEFCPSLRQLWVRGTRVTLDALISLAQRNVDIDVMEEDFILHPKLPLQS